MTAKTAFGVTLKVSTFCSNFQQQGNMHTRGDKLLATMRALSWGGRSKCCGNVCTLRASCLGVGEVVGEEVMVEQPYHPRGSREAPVGPNSPFWPSLPVIQTLFAQNPDHASHCRSMSIMHEHHASHCPAHMEQRMATCTQSRAHGKTHVHSAKGTLRIMLTTESRAGQDRHMKGQQIVALPIGHLKNGIGHRNMCVSCLLACFAPIDLNCLIRCTCQNKGTLLYLLSRGAGLGFFCGMRALCLRPCWNYDACSQSTAFTGLIVGIQPGNLRDRAQLCCKGITMHAHKSTALTGLIVCIQAGNPHDRAQFWSGLLLRSIRQKKGSG
eukprot:1152450-Pelagomonas_calceolata.AAC.2